MRSLKVAFLMDPITGINIKKDSTFAMLLEAQARGHECFYLEMADLSVRDGRTLGRLRPVQVQRVEEAHFTLGEAELRPLSDMDVVLMRKDPPFDMDYILPPTCWNMPVPGSSTTRSACAMPTKSSMPCISRN